jgi:hypothetical protein
VGRNSSTASPDRWMLSDVSCVAPFHQNRRHVLIGSMDLSNDDLEQIAAADRRR